MSGGGSGLIIIPAWIILGYPLPVALASAEISGVIWTPIAAHNYLKVSTLDRELTLLLILFGLVGVALGAYFVLEVDPELLKRLVGLIVLALVALAYLKKDLGLERQSPTHNKFLSSLGALPLGFYEAIFGSGNGIFTSLLLIKTRGLDLISALTHYYIVCFFWCIFAAGIYIYRGHGDMSLIVPAAIGAAAGAYVGSLIGSKRGAKFAKMMFMTVGCILGFKLALGF